MRSTAALLGKILRLPLALIPREAEVRILRGPLRGIRWIKGAGPNAYWLGTYEVSRIRAFANTVRQGAVFYDVGANVGIYSLLAALRAGPSGRAYAFEPLERNLRYLRRHISLNKVQNCTVFEQAVCNEEGMCSFSAAAVESSMARLSPDGEILVPSTTLDNCIYGPRRLPPPDIVKIDVEGAELEVLKGSYRALAEFRPTIFLEIHGTQLHADCRAFLSRMSYRIDEGYGQMIATPAHKPTPCSRDRATADV
jgi:FkbM family methyltransferase